MIAVPKVKKGQIKCSKNKATEIVSGNKEFKSKYNDNKHRCKSILIHITCNKGLPNKNISDLLLNKGIF